MYDLLVAGAGIAGLHVATTYLTSKGSPPQAASTHPTRPSGLLLVERNHYLGGRIYTHHQTIPGKGNYRWEAGAGRIPINHKRIIKHIKNYCLQPTTIRLPPDLSPSPRLLSINDL